MENHTPPSEEVDLFNPELFINRELSLLEFNHRVLEQAKDENVPLLERLRYLCIAGLNLDEFFEVRVAGLKQQQVYGSTQRGADNLSATEQLSRIAVRAGELVAEQYRLLNEVLLPHLDIQRVRFLPRSAWNEAQSRWIKQFFKHELAPILSPIGLDPSHPFPNVLNKGLNFIVTLKGRDAFGRNSSKAVVQAPRSLPRVVRLPEKCAGGENDFVFLSAIIQENIAGLFSGMKVSGCYEFRVTRNSNLFVDDEEIDDLLRALEGELPSRFFGEAVRLELSEDCPDSLEKFLGDKFKLQKPDIYRCDGPVNLSCLAAIPDSVDRPELKFAGFTPAMPSSIRQHASIFDAIKRNDILMHHPFDSFAPVIDFINQAALDKDVLSIRQTLYRTGLNSAIVHALVQAAEAGKEVLVVIELRARFDEEENIELANVLQAAGVQVVYGVVGHKTHAKMSMVVRREGRKLQRFVHLGTGNYHARTARLYTDFGLFTCDEDMCEDVHKIFQLLTAMGREGKLKKMLQSPFTLHDSLLDLIEDEIDNALEGKPARIMAKMNSLNEPQVIRALYRASRAGVKIDLIVRGHCCLRPGVKGISENIHVRSVIGRFLEHTRVFYFEAAGAQLVLLSSADWMHRNFFDRVESCFPVIEPKLKARVIRESFEFYLADNIQAWVLQSDGCYLRETPGDQQRFCAQQALLDAIPST
ncbi:MAG: polyphosphate kinase 1 [Pseudomonadales bacterium]|nr:polyphosphate kinase 1 [Pseudomonadales bacterium]